MYVHEMMKGSKAAYVVDDEDHYLQRVAHAISFLTQLGMCIVLTEYMGHASIKSDKVNI